MKGNPIILTPNYRNAGGYGFWCNKECAARKDAQKSADLTKQQTQMELLQYVVKNDSGTGISPLLIGGIVMGMVVFSGVIIYVTTK